jgi:hypothetical protein
MSEKNQGRFWASFIIGILGFGIYMIVWTVKSASSVPVHESNNYMLKYQMADINMNELLAAKKLFDDVYTIELQNVELIKLSDEDRNSNSKYKQPDPLKLLNGANSFSYVIKKRDGTVVNDANVTFLLTRPHSRNYDTLQTSVPFVDGSYKTTPIELKDAGRYTLQLRAYVNDSIGYAEAAAYLKP